MGYVLAVLSILCLGLALYGWRLIRLEHTAQKQLPLLKKDPVSFTAFWEKKYKRMRLPQTKNASLFLVCLGYARQGKPRQAMERMRFLNRKDPVLDRDAVNALYHTLLLQTGAESEGAAFYSENAASVDRGKRSPWMDA